MKPVRIFLAASLFASFCFLLSCGGKNKKTDASKPANQGARPPARVDAFLVQKRTVSESIDIPGTLVASESTEIHPEVAGRIVQLNVREGTVVGQGAVIARLYDGDLQAQKKKFEVQLQIANQTQGRYEQLQKIGGISKQDYDVTVLNVSNIRADLAIINTSIAKTVIRAPFTGKLGLKAVSIGAYVSPTSIITTIQKTNSLRIDFNVPEKYAGQLSKGQPVKFVVEGNKQVYTASVMASESGIAEETRTLTIRAMVNGAEAGLVPGSFAKVKVDFKPDTNAIMIPTQSIIPQARGKKVYVFRGGVAKFVDVSTGVRDSVMVQITEGIVPGDTVITTGLLTLKPDAKVAIRRVTNVSKKS